MNPFLAKKNDGSINFEKGDIQLAGVVILYNPGKDVYDNIMTYVSDLDVLYILDNSNLPDLDVIDKIKMIPHVKYIKHHHNMGISKSLNEALSLTKEKYKWLLTMDQDTKFKEGTFGDYLKTLSYLPNLEKVYGFTPRYIGESDDTTAYRMIEKGGCITSGNIINISIALSCGGFDENLFIDSVDEEFCLRCRKRGFFLYEYTKRIMIQKIGNPHVVKIGRFKICQTSNHNYIRLYYITRNALYVSTKYPQTKSYYYPIILKRIIKVILFEPDKIRKLHFMAKGFMDFIHNKMGEIE